MAITIKRTGFGQVEPNHLSAPRDGRVYAQLKANKDIEVLEQGTFAKYDMAADEVNFTGDGEWMLVYNEEKLYDERKQTHKDYAMQKAEAVDGEISPRLYGTVTGDIYTTNMVKEGDYEVGDTLAPGTDGVLEKTTGNASGMVWKVVKETTMPDMQPAVKLQRIN